VIFARETDWTPGRPIGIVVEFGLGMQTPFPVTFKGGICYADPVTTDNTWKSKGLKSRCPHNCFPADAQVVTRSGTKSMNHLRAGDKVLAVDQGGKLVFDDVYFFGHAELDTTEEYLELSLTNPQNETDAMKHQQLILEVSNDHFIPICMGSAPSCTWGQRT